MVNVTQRDDTPCSESWTTCTTHSLGNRLMAVGASQIPVLLRHLDKGKSCFTLLARARMRPGAAVLLVRPRGRQFLLDHEDMVQ